MDTKDAQERKVNLVFQGCQDLKDLSDQQGLLDLQEKREIVDSLVKQVIFKTLFFNSKCREKGILIDYKNVFTRASGCRRSTWTSWV